MSKAADWPYVINLGNSIIGVSVLAMPFCFRQCGVLLGTVLLMTSAFLCLISCNLLMKGAFYAKRRSYEFLALHVFGGVGKLAVELSIIGLLIGTCVAFHVIIGDLGPAILSRVLGIENSDNLRTGLMVFLGVFVALPLGLLRNIDSLSNISAISLGFYTVFLAEVLTAAFPNLWSGIWVTKVELWRPEGVFRCLPIFALSFGCHSQLFILVEALPDASAKRMTGITKNAISLCTAFYLAIGVFGYVAFCTEDISGDILMNFRPTIISESVKLGFVLSVAVSFPLVIYPCRTAIHMLLCAKVGTHENFSGPMTIPEPHFKLITAAVVFGTLIIGIFVPNVEFVLAMTGSTMGSMICFIFPAVIYIKLMSMVKSSNKSIAQVILFLGVTLLLASTYMTLYAQPKLETKLSVAEIQQDQLPLALPSTISPKVEGPANFANNALLSDNSLQDKEGEKKKENNKMPNPDDDHRHEPPNPHAPPDDAVNGKVGKDEPSDKAGDEKTGENYVENPDDSKNKEEDTIVEEDKKGDGSIKEALKKAEEEKNQLIEELEKQREEQKEMIEQQKLLLEEMKQHKDAHDKEAEENKARLEAGNKSAKDTQNQAAEDTHVVEHLQNKEQKQLNLNKVLPQQQPQVNQIQLQPQQLLQNQQQQPQNQQQQPQNQQQQPQNQQQLPQNQQQLPQNQQQQQQNQQQLPQNQQQLPQNQQQQPQNQQQLQNQQQQQQLPQLVTNIPQQQQPQLQPAQQQLNQLQNHVQDPHILQQNPSQQNLPQQHVQPPAQQNIPQQQNEVLQQLQNIPQQNNPQLNIAQQSMPKQQQAVPQQPIQIPQQQQQRNIEQQQQYVQQQQESVHRQQNNNHQLNIAPQNMLQQHQAMQQQPNKIQQQQQQQNIQQQIIDQKEQYIQKESQQQNTDQHLLKQNKYVHSELKDHDAEPLGASLHEILHKPKEPAKTKRKRNIAG